MKRFFQFILIIFALVVVVAGCKKQVAQIFLLGGNAPALTASVSDSIPLSFASQNNTALALNWTNPNYQLTTGSNSQDVNYTIEIDTAGANFTNPNKQTLSVSKDVGMTFIQSQFNDYLLNQLVLKPGMSHNLEIRVKSGVGTNSAAQLISNVLKFRVIPYAIPPKVTPPTSAKLYITGSATQGNWMNGGDPEKVSQKFTKVSDTQYEIVLPLIGGGSYVFVPTYGDWGNKYAIKVKNDPASVNGGDFQVNGEDILAPATSGNYKIVVDFQRGKFTVTP